MSYLKENPGGITQLDAARMFGCFRLAARISDLKKDGHRITSEMESRNGKTYSRYRLEKEECSQQKT